MKVYVANHIGPEPCAGIRKGVGEASVGERAGQPLSRERYLISGADAVQTAEGDMIGRDNASARKPDVVGDPGMHGRSLRGNREISGLASAADARGSALGRRGADANDARFGEVRLLHTSEEVGEPTWATGRGVDGAKEGDQGEHGRVTREPDTEPGNRDWRAGPCTASSKRQMPALPSTIQGKSPVPESGSLGSVRGVRRNGHPYRDHIRESKFRWA